MPAPAPPIWPGTLVVYTVLRLALVIVLTAVLAFFMPLIVALLFAIIVQLPLAWLLFSGPRTPGQRGDGAVIGPPPRRAARLQSALSGDDRPLIRYSRASGIVEPTEHRRRARRASDCPTLSSAYVRTRSRPDARARRRPLRPAPRAWVAQAVRLIEADLQRSADTHLLRFPLAVAEPWRWTTGRRSVSQGREHPRHRLAEAPAGPFAVPVLAVQRLAEPESTTVIESSSGSTAVSEAYFARMIGLPFVAVMPARTSREKIELIEAQGGRCHLVSDPGAIYAESRRLAAEMRRALHGPVHPRRAGDRLARQQQHRRVDLRPAPAGAAPGPGMDRRRGRHRRHQRHHRPVRPVPRPPDQAVRPGPGGLGVLPGLAGRRSRPGPAAGSRIEGIGRPRVEPSFVGQAIDRMVRVPDAASVGTMREVESVLGRRVGPSTGTNLWAAFGLIAGMRASRHRRVDRHPAVRRR